MSQPKGSVSGKKYLEKPRKKHVTSIEIKLMDSLTSLTMH